MKNTFITNSSEQTQKLGELLAIELKGGEIVCLSGELGSGKTTFTQGVLKGLGAKGPYTSPTFVVMKHYRIRTPRQGSTFSLSAYTSNSSRSNLSVYHIDAYRIGSKDILDLGWEEIIHDKKNIVIIEWAERIKSIIPKGAIWLKFQHEKGDQRKITVK